MYLLLHLAVAVEQQKQHTVVHRLVTQSLRNVTLIYDLMINYAYYLFAYVSIMLIVL